MKLRIGYELDYVFPQPTPLILMLNVHFSRFSDLQTPDHMRIEPDKSEQFVISQELGCCKDISGLHVRHRHNSRRTIASAVDSKAWRTFSPDLALVHSTLCRAVRKSSGNSAVSGPGIRSVLLSTNVKCRPGMAS